jgi:ElaB/YqjD/DUF883 family membrane-anchored ribosome-binding protein
MNLSTALSSLNGHSMPHDIRSELSELQDDLVSKANPTLGESTLSERMGPQPKEKWTDLERVLRELQTQLADAAGEAEAVLAEHPFAAVAAAFILGVAAGRMMGAGK